MATYTVNKINYNSNKYILQDSGALQLTGGSVTGPVTFGDSVTMDEATVGDIVVNGSASFTNGVKASSYNGGQPTYTVVGTQTAATGAWTGNIDAPALYDGMRILYYLPYAGSGNATLNLTLSNGITTGAINCYYNTGRLTTHYGAGQNFPMTYWSAGSIKINGTATTDDRWIIDAQYDSNTKVTQSAAITTAGQYPVILGYNTGTTSVTNTVNKSANLTYNPNTKKLTNAGAIQCGTIDNNYGLNDQALLSGATINKWKDILGIEES